MECPVGPHMAPARPHMACKTAKMAKIQFLRDFFTLQKQVLRVGIEPTTLYIVVISRQHLYHLGYVARW